MATRYKIATQDRAETFTNKTLTSPLISNPYKFRAYRSADLTLTADAWTKAPLEAEDFDTNSNFDITTNNRYTVPVSGYYHFSGRMGFNGTKSMVILVLWKNGAEIARGGDTRVASQGTNGLLVSTDLYLAANDYIELYYYCDEAIAIETGSAKSYLSGFLISI